MAWPNMTGHNAPNVPNILRKLLEEQQAQQQFYEEQMPDHAGLAPQDAPIDYGMPMQPKALPQMNALREAVQIPDYAPMPAVMPRTTVEDNSRWKSEPGSDMPMNSFRTESGPNAGVTRSLNFADINPAWGQQELQSDFSQPIEIAGVGKGYYEKGGTGNAIINGKRVAMGVDPMRVRDNEKWRLAQAKAKQELEQGQVSMMKDQEAIEASRAARSVREDPNSQANLEKRFGKADKGKTWTPDGRMIAAPGSDAEQQQGDAVAGAQETIRKIDEMVAHPGLSDAVGAKWGGGLSMMLGMQPVAGTDAADFVSRLDEIKGGAFLQAFENLKGGGQITEVEGKKATDAITRMRTAQSEVEFKKAAMEFRNVVETGMKRIGGKSGNQPGQSGGSGAPRPGEVRRGYRFRGGDPAQQSSWERA